MLEEGNMEKKPVNRNSPVPVKTNPGDKKTDNVRFQRNTRKKENGSRAYQDVNPNKKPFPQKARSSSDKRPRPRGHFNDKPRNEVADQLGAEFDSVYYKNDDLSHMINFDYGSRRNIHGFNRGARRPHRYSRGGVFNKQQYLQANCQFVVKDCGDYSIHAIDPDQLVDWDSIEQVCMSSPDVPLCPICLSYPMAGKITKCGHIYCWSCILHYLALSEKEWHKCPICNDSVYQKDLRSVKTIEVSRYKVGDTITLNLMRRERGSTISVARACWKGIPIKPFNVKDANQACYSKLLVASPADVQVLVTKPENEELLMQMSNAEESEYCFIESALQQQQVRLSQLHLSPSKPEEEELSTELDHLNLNDSCTASTVQDVPKNSKNYIDAFDDMVTEEIGTTPVSKPDSDRPTVIDKETLSLVTASTPLAACINNNLTEKELMPTEEAAQCLELPHDLEDDANRKRKFNSNPKNTFYFYQAADGQHIYLHAVNARCLVNDYGNLMNCPDTIEATIVEIESITMTEDLRKRLRYLNHLPLSAEFKVVELLLKAPILSKETLRLFSDEIEKRRRIRQKKLREERLRSKRIQEEENRKYGMSPVKIVMSSAAEIDNQLPLPALPPPMVDYNSLAPTPFEITSSSGDPPLESSSGASSCFSDGNQATSFAQMLKSGKVRPTFANNATSAILRPEAALHGQLRCSDGDVSDSEGKVPVPNFQNSFGAAIQSALDNLDQNNGPSRSGGGKKKKMKKLLFATTMARGM